MYKYKIIYRDGSTQTVEAGGYQFHGDWAVFTDGGGIVLSVKSSDVESIARDGVEERITRAAA